MKLPDDKPIQLSPDILENDSGLHDLDQVQTDLSSLKEITLRLEWQLRRSGGIRRNIVAPVIATLLATAIVGAVSWAWTSQSLASSKTMPTPVCIRPEHYLDV